MNPETYSHSYRPYVQPKVELKAVMVEGMPTRITLTVTTDETKTLASIDQLITVGRRIVDGVNPHEAY